VPGAARRSPARLRPRNGGQPERLQFFLDPLGKPEQDQVPAELCQRIGATLASGRSFRGGG
jgi:hypothetical protein